MKRSVAKWVSQCDSCQRVKKEHQVSAGLLRTYQFLHGNGCQSRWILSLDYQQDQDVSMMLHG